jgi:D-serine deaminase-like pyridoxal phosphate-dependent protein
MTRDWFEVENVETIPSPALLLYPERIQANLRTMLRQAGDASRLRPHVKTHKLRPIVDMKLAEGITRFKTATLVETQMVAAAGGPDILWAYQPVGPQVESLIELSLRYQNTRFSTLIDDLSAAQRLSQAAVKRGQVLNVFVDLNVGMNRTGIAIGPQARQLYEQLLQMPGVMPVGVHAYDGHIRAADLVERRRQWTPVADSVENFREELTRILGTAPQVVAGGSSTSGLWLERSQVEVSAGTTTLWDYGQTKTCPESEIIHAAVLLARVISRPAEGLLCLDLGHKAVAAEMPQPRVQWFGLESAEVVSQSEEHLVLRTEQAADYPVGRVLYGLPYHICPTTALYDEVWPIRRGRAEDRWVVTARGRQLYLDP